MVLGADRPLRGERKRPGHRPRPFHSAWRRKLHAREVPPARLRQGYGGSAV